jgi:tripartite-type tricarboxylate transporter receptor subunit TctC
MDKRVVALAGVLIAFAFPADAQISYPKKSVTLVTHSVPGGGSDVYLRVMSKYLGPIMGVNFGVENVRGGSGAKAVTKLAGSPPDGSIFYATTPTYIDMSILSKPQYGYKDLEPVVNFFTDPQVVFVRNDFKFKDLKDTMADAKARPGKQRWGSGTAGSLERQTIEEMKTKYGLDIIVATHDGGAELTLNVLNGAVEIGLGQIAEIRGQLDAGKIRLLGALTEKRLEDFPNVATAREQGFDLVSAKFRGLAGPKGLSPDVIKAWESAVPKVLADAEFKKWYRTEQLIPNFISHKDYAPFIDEFAKEQEVFFKKYNITTIE